MAWREYSQAKKVGYIPLNLPNSHYDPLHKGETVFVSTGAGPVGS